MEPLSALVVGAGSGGSGSIRALAASPRYVLRGVADIASAARQRVAAAHPGVALFADHREALQSLQPDVVCVSTWPPSHVAVTRDALAAGSLRGLLLEKPIAHTWQDGRRLVDELRRCDLPCVVPHGLVVSSQGRAVIDQVRAGTIGTPRLVWIECRGWDILNAGIHWLHFALQVVRGPLVEVQCACDSSTRTWRDGMQVETVASLVVTAADGARIALHTGDEVPMSAPAAGTLIRLVGSEGLIELPGWEPRYRVVSARHRAGAAAGSAGEVQVPAGPPSHAAYLDRLADQIAAGTPPMGAGGASLAALELCDAAYTSARDTPRRRQRATCFAGGTGAGQLGPDGFPGGGRDGRPRLNVRTTNAVIMVADERNRGQQTLHEVSWMLWPGASSATRWGRPPRARVRRDRAARGWLDDFAGRHRRHRARHPGALADSHRRRHHRDWAADWLAAWDASSAPSRESSSSPCCTRHAGCGYRARGSPRSATSPGSAMCIAPVGLVNACNPAQAARQAAHLASLINVQEAGFCQDGPPS